MKFRQRVAWLLLFLYLFGTLITAYYLFELSDHYRSNALDHVNKYHNIKGEGNFWYHLIDVPFPIWIIIFIIPYLQVFWVLLLCTRSEPVVQFRACLLPVIGWYFICGLRPSLMGKTASSIPRSCISQKIIDENECKNEDNLILLG